MVWDILCTGTVRYRYFCMLFSLLVHTIASYASTSSPADVRAAAVAYLHHHRHPKFDAAVPLEQHVTLALEARASTAWASAVPWPIFCEAVLPPGCLDEPRDDWRTVLRPRCSELVRGATSTAEAALTLNRAVWDEFKVRYLPNQSPKVLAPLTVLEHGYASCSGLSLLLIACCRSVGVPARVAGIADWGDGSGNHVWVEVWTPDGWHSLGAAEPSPLDSTWFAERLYSAEAPRVFASSFAPSESSFPLPWASAETDSWPIPAIDVTPSYRRGALRSDGYAGNVSTGD